MRLAVTVDESGNKTIAAIAIRGLAAFEIEIPKAKYDGFAMMELIGKHEKEVE